MNRKFQIVARSDGRFVVVIVTGRGASRTKSHDTSHDTREAAQRRVIELEIEESQGFHRKKKDETVAQYFDEWLRQLDPQTPLKSVKNYTWALHKIAQHLGRYKLQELDPRLIERTLDVIRKTPSKRKRPLAPRSYTLVKAMLRWVLNDAVELEYFPKSPMRKQREVKIERKEVQVLRAAERAFLAERVLSEPWSDVYFFLMGTGVRISEACGVNWGELDLAGGWYHLKAQRIQHDRFNNRRGPPKSGKPRTIPLLPEAVAMLTARRERVLAQMRETGQLVRSLDASLVFPEFHSHDLSQRMAGFFDRIGMAHITAHVMRHTYATRLLLEFNVPLPMVQAILGHHSAKLTSDTYCHVQSEDLAMVKRLAAGFGDVPPAAGVVSLLNQKDMQA